MLSVLRRSSSSPCPAAFQLSGAARGAACAAHAYNATLLACDRAVGVPAVAVAWLLELIATWSDPARADPTARLALLVASDVGEQRALRAELTVAADLSALAKTCGARNARQSEDGVMLENQRNGGYVIDVRIVTPLAAILLGGKRRPDALFVCDLQRVATSNSVPFVPRVLLPALSNTLEAREPPRVCAVHVVASGRAHSANVASATCSGEFAIPTGDEPRRTSAEPRVAARQLTCALLDSYAKALLQSEAELAAFQCKIKKTPAASVPITRARSQTAVKRPVVATPRRAEATAGLAASLRGAAKLALLLANRPASATPRPARGRRRSRSFSDRPTRPAPKPPLPPERTPSRSESSSTASGDDSRYSMVIDGVLCMWPDFD